MKKAFAIFGLLAMFVAGCGSNTTETVTQTQTVIIKEAGSSTQTVTEIASTDAASVAGPFSGTGDLTTQKFALKAGAVRFNYKNADESGLFSVWLKDEKANDAGLVVSNVGPVESTKVLNIKRDGNYMLDIKSGGGNWTITMQPE